jgi:DNA gyrase subunit A
MTDPLDLVPPDRVIPIALHQEMQRSYLEYAMSVIVGRALPDARDGLKPVQRRILYAMHELGLTPDRPFRKCARVVGDVLGKYHPHGDQAVYDALVRLVQEFASRYPLLGGHGNFGSIDNDPPAAMRYTETRLAPISHEALLGEIGLDTVQFAPNFDNSQQEPVVLPAQLPFLLLNGCSGIAVGMATNIPPHNLGEVVDGLIALIDRPDLSDYELLGIIPGPDFPTGGLIIDRAGIRETYLTGRGSIPMRGVATLEEIQPGKGRHRRPVIIISELPYQVSKAGWIEKVAELVNLGKLEGIADIRDESDREGMRVVVELRRDADPRKVLDSLYRKTPLQSNFGAILLALVDGQPLQLTLKQLLQHFLDFRESTLTRRYRHDLEHTEQRLEVVDGLRLALAQLDRAIALVREAPDAATARAALQVQLELSERQADAVLAMPLRRLTALEQDQLQQEQVQLREKQAELQTLLGDRRVLLKALKKELRDLKRRFANPRLTRVPEVNPRELVEPLQPVAKLEQTSLSFTDSGAEPDTLNPSLRASLKRRAVPEDAEPDAEARVVVWTGQGQIQRVTPQTLADRALLVPQPDFQTSEDSPLWLQPLEPRQTLLILGRQGKAYNLEAAAIPARRQGVPLVSLLGSSAEREAIAGILALPDSDIHSLLLLSQQGRLKRLPLDEVRGLSSRGVSVIKLEDGDELAFACLGRPGQSLVLATSSGRLLRLILTEAQVPLMGKPAKGNPVIRVRPTETLVGCVCLDAQQDLVLVSQGGYGKRLPTMLLRQGQPRDLGVLGFRFAQAGDRLLSVQAALPESILSLATATQVSRWPMDEVPIYGLDSGGSVLVDLEEEDLLQSVAVLRLLQPKVADLATS